MVKRRILRNWQIAANQISPVWGGFGARNLANIVPLGGSQVCARLRGGGWCFGSQILV